MNKSRAVLFSFLTALIITAMSITFAYAQKAGAVKIEGSYKVVLKLPKATPTAILIFYSKGEPFTGAWVQI